jgi:hypothetical protein
MIRTVQHFIDNTSTAGSSTRTGDIYNPALGEKTGDVVMGTALMFRLLLTQQNGLDRHGQQRHLSAALV